MTTLVQQRLKSDHEHFCVVSYRNSVLETRIKENVHFYNSSNENFVTVINSLCGRHGP